MLTVLTAGLVFAVPSAEASGLVTVSHVPPAVVYSGVDLPLRADFTYSCLMLEYCDAVVVTLKYNTPWNTVEQVETSVFYTEGHATLVLPGTAIRSLYAQIADIPLLSYWFEASPDGAGNVVRTPATGTYNVPVVNHVSMTVTNEVGDPLANLHYRLDLLMPRASETAPEEAPITFATGTTDSSGAIDLILTPTQDVLTAAERNGGYANYLMLFSCNIDPDPYGNDCVPSGGPDPIINENYYAVTALYANYGETADNVQVSGISIAQNLALTASRTQGTQTTVAAGDCPAGWDLEGVELHSSYNQKLWMRGLRKDVAYPSFG